MLNKEDTLELCSILESGNIQELLEEFIALRGFNENPLKPCDTCGTPIDADIHAEELGMCLTCSNAYWSHEGE